MVFRRDFLFRQARRRRELRRPRPHRARPFKDDRPPALHIPQRRTDDNFSGIDIHRRAEVFPSFRQHRNERLRRGPRRARERIDECRARIRRASQRCADDRSAARKRHRCAEVAARIRRQREDLFLPPRRALFAKDIDGIRRPTGRADECRAYANRHRLPKRRTRRAVVRAQFHLLRPQAVRAGENVRRARVRSRRVVARRTDDHRVAFDSHRFSKSLPGTAPVARIELGLLHPAAAVPLIDEHHATRRILLLRAHDQRIAADRRRRAHVPRIERRWQLKFKFLRPAHHTIDRQLMQDEFREVQVRHAHTADREFRRLVRRDEVKARQPVNYQRLDAREGKRIALGDYQPSPRLRRARRVRTDRDSVARYTQRIRPRTAVELHSRRRIRHAIRELREDQIVAVLAVENDLLAGIRDPIPDVKSLVARTAKDRRVVGVSAVKHLRDVVPRAERNLHMLRQPRIAVQRGSVHRDRRIQRHLRVSRRRWIFAKRGGEISHPPWVCDARRADQPERRGERFVRDRGVRAYGRSGVFIMHRIVPRLPVHDQRDPAINDCIRINAERVQREPARQNRRADIHRIRAAARVHGERRVQPIRRLFPVRAFEVNRIRPRARAQNHALGALVDNFPEAHARPRHRCLIKRQSGDHIADRVSLCRRRALVVNI